MKPGERIRLIEECAELLTSISDPRMQLILRNHGAKTWEGYDDGFDGVSKESYAIDRCESLNDSELEVLHTYLRGDEAAPAEQQTTDRPWGSNPVAVFISHRHEDAVFASEVGKYLAKRWGIDAFVAHNDIDPSKVWRNTIRSALASCHFMVAILHPEFHDSQWCDQEVGWAMGRGIPIMPVRLGPAPHRRDGFLEEYQDCVVDLGKQAPPHWLSHRIFQAVLGDPRTHRIGVKALAEAFVNSSSFAQTDLLWELIEAEVRWETEQLRRLEYAVETNSQIYNCRTAGKPVPELVKDLVARFEPPAPAPSGQGFDPWAPPASDEPPF